MNSTQIVVNEETTLETISQIWLFVLFIFVNICAFIVQKRQGECDALDRMKD